MLGLFAGRVPKRGSGAPDVGHAAKSGSGSGWLTGGGENGGTDVAEKNGAADPSAARMRAQGKSGHYFDFFADCLPAAAVGCGGFLPSGFGG